MKNSFKEKYKQIEKSKKLDFLEQLLLKDSDLQKQFIEFSSDKNSNLDNITAINIDKVRDELWNELSMIDIENELDGRYYDYYDDEGMGDTILEPIFEPFVNRALSFVDKGNYLDAFRSILAIYELKLVETPDIEDDEYFVFGENIESYIEDYISSSMVSFNSKMEHKVLSVEMVNLLITLFFERYLKYENDEECYDIAEFNLFFKHIIDKPENAKYLLKKLKEFKLDKFEDSANIILHCADIIDDNKLYLKVADEFFMYDKQVALKLQKRYKSLNMDEKLAEISLMLLEKEDSADYALFVIENIDKEIYEGLYIIALQIYITAEYSFKHYLLLREYFDEDERLEFIKAFESKYDEPFYIQLLEVEKQYKTILNFVKKNRDSYYLDKLIKPIITIYPDEVFNIIKALSDKLVKGRGRDSYARACNLLQLLLDMPTKKEELKSYINELYNHKPRLPALRDELNKARLLY